jgi:predicted RNA-binding protein
MCEFKVILEGKIVFKDAVYARVDGDMVTVADIIGSSKKFEKCRIVEVDVNSTRLKLSPVEY